MGGSDSKGSVHGTSLHFTEEEKPMVSRLFFKISHGKKSFNREHFRHFAHGILDGEICDKLYELLHGSKHHQRLGHHHHHQEGEVDSHHFTQYLATILKGGIAEQAILLTSLCSPDHIGYVLPDHLVKFVTSMLQSYEKLLSAHCREYQSWIFAPPGDSFKRLALFMLEDLFFVGNPKDKGFNVPSIPKEKTFATDEVESWISKSSLFQQIFHEVFHGCFKLYENDPADVTFLHPRVPHVCDTNWSRVSTVLDLASVLFINSDLPENLQGEWRLIFSNSLHGDSFSQLIKMVQNKGPTVLVVRDHDGHLFGGFASQPWKICPQFYGDSGCFLFRLNPNFGVYQPTGYNANFMYLNLNMQTLPNGLGMGGQFDYFGLWIADSFSSGQSKAEPRCLTYGSPQLSYLPEFRVDAIEVWAVGSLKKKEEDYDEEELEEQEKLAKKSILDKDPEAKAMLELMGRAPVSEGLREADETAHTPESSKVISLF